MLLTNLKLNYITNKLKQVENTTANADVLNSVIDYINENQDKFDPTIDVTKLNAFVQKYLNDNNSLFRGQIGPPVAESNIVSALDSYFKSTASINFVNASITTLTSGNTTLQKYDSNGQRNDQYDIQSSNMKINNLTLNDMYAQSGGSVSTGVEKINVHNLLNCSGGITTNLITTDSFAINSLLNIGNNKLNINPAGSINFDIETGNISSATINNKGLLATDNIVLTKPFTQGNTVLNKQRGDGYDLTTGKLQCIEMNITGSITVGKNTLTNNNSTSTNTDFQTNNLVVNSLRSDPNQTGINGITCNDSFTFNKNVSISNQNFNLGDVSLQPTLTLPKLSGYLQSISIGFNSMNFSINKMDKLINIDSYIKTTKPIICSEIVLEPSSNQLLIGSGINDNDNVSFLSKTSFYKDVEIGSDAKTTISDLFLTNKFALPMTSNDYLGTTLSGTLSSTDTSWAYKINFASNDLRLAPVNTSQMQAIYIGALCGFVNVKSSALVITVTYNNIFGDLNTKVLNTGNCALFIRCGLGFSPVSF